MQSPGVTGTCLGIRLMQEPFITGKDTPLPLLNHTQSFLFLLALRGTNLQITKRKATSVGVNIQNANAEYLIVHTHTHTHIHTHSHICGGGRYVYSRERKRREREMKGWRKMEREEGKGRAGTASQSLGNDRSSMQGHIFQVTETIY